MEIQQLRATTLDNGRVHASAVMGGGQLWFEFPSICPLPATYADSFAIMGLVPSMLRNEPLVVPPEFPVSATLLANFEQVQKILHCWNPAFKHVRVDARATPPSEPLPRTASVFSGGVDSLHTLSLHRSEVTDAILIGGFDMQISADAFATSIDRNRAIVDYLGSRLIDVQTNQREWGEATGIRRTFWYGAYLAAVALFFRFERVLIPSGHTYAELAPAGSHLILDPLWSNGCTRFEQTDAEFRRSSKVAHIAHDPFLLESLRVCWKDQNTNCGACPKCLRTMVTLAVLGTKGPFPRVATPKDARSIYVRSWEGMSYLLDNVQFAAEHGRRDFVKATQVAIRRYDRLQALTYIDRGLLFGMLHALRKRLRPYPGHGQSSTRPDQDI